MRASVLGNPRVPFYGVLLAVSIAEQGRRDEAVEALREAMGRHPDYRRAAITDHWTGAGPRFMAGRDRLVEHAARLGLPP